MPIKKFLADSTRLIDFVANSKKLSADSFKQKADKYLYDYHQHLAKENILIKQDYQEVEKTLDDIIQQARAAKELLHQKLERCYEDAQTMVNTMLHNKQRV